MSNANGSHEDRRFDELSPELAAAVEAVLARPAPELSVERALARIAGRFAADGSIRNERPRRSRRWLLAAGMAAAVLAAAGVWLWRPSVSWAEVAKALAGKPWIHGVSKEKDGTTVEWWFSIERGVFAQRYGKQALFEDNRLHVRYEYDADANRIHRQLSPEKDAGRSAAELFEGIMRGKVRAGLFVGDEEVIAQEARRVVDGGRQWLEYDLTLRSRFLGTNRLTQLRFRVDPETQLPYSMKVTPMAALGGPIAADAGFERIFDYPDHGPADIYDLGAPRTAELIDRVPNDDLKRIIAAVESGRNDFDSYFAVVVSQGANDPWYSGEQTLIWRKGNRWRAEIGHFNEQPPQPEADADRVAWWNEQVRQGKYQPVEVCDGKTVYRDKFDVPDAHGKQSHAWEAVRRLQPGEGIEVASQGLVRDRFPELYAYPMTLVAPSSHFTVEIDPHPAEGPNDSLLLKYLATPEFKIDGAFFDNRYWVDPGKGYATRRYLMADGHQAGASRSDAYTMEDFERSPRGIWYPTLVRRKVTMDPPPAENWTDETVMRFFLDFEAEIPDELFGPVDRE
ncbi:MAG TPA: hypothetical protein VHB99_17310 [Pirellulales bacterium]|nr:hypothetical protein [Pirellulales bacterium]